VDEKDKKRRSRVVQKQKLVSVEAQEELNVFLSLTSENRDQRRRANLCWLCEL